MMKRDARTVYRVRAVWGDRMWVVRSPDVEGLLVQAHRFDEVAPVARNAIARIKDVHSSTIDVAVQPVSMADPELQWQVERGVASQEHAKALAEEAAERTLDAVDALSQSGMDYVDARRLLGLTDDFARDRRRGYYGVQALDDDPWLRRDEEDDWNPVNPWSRWDFSSNDPSFPARLLKALGDEVGGPGELAVLGDASLPDEDFAWDRIPDDVVPMVAEVLVQCDLACDAVFDVEARTAARRLLAFLARRDSKAFRRGKAAGIAGAVCWIVGEANHLWDNAVGPRQKDLSAALGIANARGRAGTFLVAGEFTDDRYWFGRVVLGSAAFLVSAHRRRIVELRDQYTVSGPVVTRQEP
jgi:hypothetical protein